MQRPAAAPSPNPAREITCPFCALHCDDLEIDSGGARPRPLNTGCRRAQDGFAAADADAVPRLHGRTATLDAALDAAATILRRSRSPLYAGLGADVAGVRAVLALADRTGGIVDHMHADALVRNTAALGDGGWMTTTLTEVRNRADFILFAGTDATAMPRFFERLVWNPASQFGLETRNRAIAYLGDGLDTRPGRAPDGRAPTVLRCPQDRIREVLGALRALNAGRTPQATKVAGVPLTALRKLLERMRTATYGVIVWAPASLDFPHAELTVEALCDLVRDLNTTARWSGLPVGGDDGAITYSSVCAWTTGYPLRVGFGSGQPVFDPRGNGAATLLAQDAVDSLTWISSYAPVPAPRAAVPRVVLGHPATPGARAADVFIPVATPGVHHAGHAIRMDTVVTLPLSALAPSPHLSVADVAARLAARLE